MQHHLPENPACSAFFHNFASFGSLDRAFLMASSSGPVLLLLVACAVPGNVSSLYLDLRSKRFRMSTEQVQQSTRNSHQQIIGNGTPLQTANIANRSLKNSPGITIRVRDRIRCVFLAIIALQWWTFATADWHPRIKDSNSKLRPHTMTSIMSLKSYKE